MNPESPSSIKKMAVIHQGALGDFLLALPVFEGIHRAFPDALVDFLAKKEHTDLISSRPYFGRVHPPDGTALTPFYHEDLWRKANPPSFISESDQVLVFGQSSARLLAQRLDRSVRPPVHWIQSFPDPNPPIPVSEFLRQQVSQVLCSIDLVSQRLTSSRDEQTAAKKWLAENLGEGSLKPVMAHPGSGGAKKVWPLRRWWALLQWLRNDLLAPVVLTLGPAEERLARFAAESERLGVRVAADNSLSRLAALLCEAQLFVGSDSGVSHLAAAVGIPVVVIFGSSDHRIWAPLGPHVHVVKDVWSESEIFDWTPGAADSRDNADIKAALKQSLHPSGT